MQHGDVTVGERTSNVRSPLLAARFLAAVGVSTYGDWLTTVALVVVLYRATGSPTGPALYILVRVAPRVLGPAPGGALADRFGPALVPAVCTLLQGLLTAAIVVLALRHVVWGIYLAVAAAQFINALSQPSYGALLPRVTAAAALGRVNSIYSVLGASSILVSPAIGALLLPHVSPVSLIVADAASFLVASTLLFSLAGRVQAAATSLRFRVSAGWPVVLNDGVLRAFAAASLANPAVATALQSVLVVAAAQHFGRDANVGWLYAAVGAGGLIGSLSFMRPTPTFVRRRGIIIASFIELMPLAIFVFAPNLGMAMLLLCISSLGGVLYQVNGSISLQQRVPVDLLGRVSAVMRFALYVGMLLGAVAATLLVQPLGWETTILAVSGAAFVLLLAAALIKPRRRGALAPLDAIPD